MTKQMVKLEFTVEQLNKLISESVDGPPYAFHLPQGMKIPDIKFRKNVGPWGLHWVNTNGRIDRGSLVLVPNSAIARKLMRQRLFGYYKSFGFSDGDANVLSGIKIRNYHDKDLIRQVKQFLTADIYDHFDKITRDTEITTSEDVESLRSSLKGKFEGRTDNARIRDLIDIFKTIRSEYVKLINSNKG